MANMNLDNEYRKINARMQKLYKETGDSTLYNIYKSMVSKNFETRIGKDGSLQIARGKANSNINKFQRAALNNILKLSTYQNIEKTAKEELKKKGQKPTKANIKKQIDKQMYVEGHKDLITWASEQAKSGRANIANSIRSLYNRLAGRDDVPTYDELYSAMKAVERTYKGRKVK